MVQVMACCLTASSHNWDQCWLWNIGINPRPVSQENHQIHLKKKLYLNIIFLNNFRHQPGASELTKAASDFSSGLAKLWWTSFLRSPLAAWSCDGTICDSLQFVTAARFVTTECFNLWPGTICDQRCFNLWPALYNDFRVQVVQGKTCFCVYTYNECNMI